jgi:radical SAM superfamily enzyme YgiQ (UPF0313 family)
MTGTLSALIIWPPHVPSYFNGGHHLHLFEVSAYLRRMPEVAYVEVLDAGALNLTWKDVGDTLIKGYDVIAVMNEFDALDGIGRCVEYARALSPASQLITFGRLSRQIPGFFERYGFDAIVESGDFEAGVGAFVRWWVGGRADLPGVAVRKDGVWIRPAQPGSFLPPHEWGLPDIAEIPYAAYDRLYSNDSNKFCGIPERRELVVPVARGCPIMCDFCDVPRQQGPRERRQPVRAVLAYIQECFEAAQFEYVAFYAPTFSLDRAWVLDLCEELMRHGARYPWKCTTTLHHLDQSLVTIMGQSGCIRISVGLETLDPRAHASLPRIKHIDEERLEAVASWCREAGIELNCFIIIGLPGGSVDGALQTAARVRALGARVRPTIYTPYHHLRADMPEEEVASFNRQLFVEGFRTDDAAALYPLIFGEEPAPTRVMNAVPRRGADS